MKLVVAGLNHRTAPVEVRERVAFRTDELSDALHRLHEQPGLREGLILSTCNRVEVTATLEDFAEPAPLLCHFLASTHGLTADSLQPHLYLFEEDDAIRHLFRVASSLDSMVVGEPQILGQLKQAYSDAREQGAVGSYLDAVLTRAFSVAKRVRTETEIGQSAVSVSYAAVELAREIFGSLNRRGMRGVSDVVRISAPYKLVSRENHDHRSGENVRGGRPAPATRGRHRYPYLQSHP